MHVHACIRVCVSGGEGSTISLLLTPKREALLVIQFLLRLLLQAEKMYSVVIILFIYYLFYSISGTTCANDLLLLEHLGTCLLLSSYTLLLDGPLHGCLPICRLVRHFSRLLLGLLSCLLRALGIFLLVLPGRIFGQSPCLLDEPSRLLLRRPCCLLLTSLGLILRLLFRLLLCFCFPLCLLPCLLLLPLPRQLQLLHLFRRSP